ncbi:acetylornithine deacetylase [Sneathiella chinensis]|uniref:Acetylornithine deacetylase n=1 Tax=Sneathiella chinensis TaxID=349750 RepID=A0ABQ5U7Z7_9PROT|nr:acetylornithine deacetylase [Sneathiella chinensis]GLQ07323.1 acetylornithine deacetylase [Sneathiella chinensis]
MKKTETGSTLHILEKLISFDTTSYRSNLDLIDYVCDYLASFDIPCKVLYNEEKNKANLLATIGDSSKPGILLSGHTDVVPIDGQNWTRDPFKLHIEDGKAFGRGTCDMKGFIASVLAAAPLFRNTDLSCPVHIALSYDEEVGCVGVRHLIDFLQETGTPVEACIIGEPSSLKPVTAHTGKHGFRCEFHGTPMHSSLAPGGVNAISYAAAVLAGINDLENKAKSMTIGDDRFEYPHPTINIGTIEGGKAVNIVAEHCAFEVECRYPPGGSPTFFTEALPALVEDVANRPMKDRNPAAGATCTETLSYPAFEGNFQSPAAVLARRLTGSNNDGAVNYGTEAGRFQTAGFSSVVCGPGDIAQAHQPDEFIALSQLEGCDRMLTTLARELSTQP